MRRDILDEHAEEIEILVSRRRTALWSHRETLDSLARLERRLDAHVRGLSLDRDQAHECFERGLHGDDADAAFAAGAALLRQRSSSALERLATALPAASAIALAGLSEAIAYESLDEASLWRLRALADANPDSPTGMAVRSGLAAHGLEPSVAPLPSLRDARARIRAGVADAGALFVIGCAGDPADLESLVGASAIPALAEQAVRALGAHGGAGAIEELLALLRHGTLAPAAGEAFARVTGVPPVECERPAAEDDDHFEELRPWPDPVATEAAWRARSGQFTGAGRWRAGEPFEPARWRRKPHAGDLLSRREAITALRLEDPAALATLELDAPAVRQRHWCPEEDFPR